LSRQIVLLGYVGYRTDDPYGLLKISGVTYEAIDQVFYALTALSAALAVGGVLSLRW